eukprot:CAMPEP_0201623144 /NCGR_PEP_ID=MMETSP0492-20130828/47776_1 /ASSEMBLY_ACC=CAM_ASM_000837 /TAXON_ID=420259 /ORGANISM="Thalassiosira gravida, Strain GMp14c1" /LENGTH=139 /DNA_ID=CAMNT_0048092765 /DNA_START=42 /DNA_END=458 /DNA_ORIENTATION=+
MSDTNDANTASILERCKNEVIRLHVFFEEWFTGKISNTDDDLERSCSSFMHANFHFINPGGATDSLSSLMEKLRHAHGAYSSTKFIIEIKNVECLFVGTDDTYLVKYEEWQKSGDDYSNVTARVSTVLFQADGEEKLKW